jgi:hypothetical protein
MRNVKTKLVRNLKGRNHLDDTGVNESIIIQRILKLQCEDTGLRWHRPESNSGFYQKSKEPYFIQCREVPDKNEYHLLKGYFCLCFLGWSGTEFTVTEATKWPIVSAPNDDGQ